MKILFIVSLLLIITSSAHAADHYINSKTGDDCNPGTKALHWKRSPDMQSWSGIKNPVRPGDTVKFKRGCIWRNAIIKPSVSGTAKPIPLTAAVLHQSLPV